MRNFKIEHSAGQTFLVIQGQKGQQISEREYYAISTGQIQGLLRAEIVRKSNTFKINYNISGFISLREFLINPLNKLSFAKLLSNILNNLKALQNAYFNHQFILMDLNAAMVNPTTQEVSFVYVPITFYESGTNLKEFLLSIIQCCSFVPGENTDYVRDYIRILNHGINFSVFDLEEYIKTLKIDDQGDKKVKKCSRCGAIIQPNVNFCSSCGFKLVGLNMDNSQGIYDPLQNISRLRQPQNLDAYSSNGAQAGYSETISNSCVNNAVNQPNFAPGVQEKAYISRMKTGEQIQITSPSFRIGKDPYNCEYCIRDNSAISRSHVVIKQVNNKWFLSDLNSTNKTYILDRPIPPNVDVELYNGICFRLANENFTFSIY